jgi:2,3-bisphosphoglycerate-dependent phosphoglycerate mutase
VETLLLARHAESELGVRELVNGDPAVAAGLTEQGRVQARRLGEELRDEPLDLCVVTEFQRVAETTDLVLEGRDVPRLVVPELNEIGYGAYEGGGIAAYLEWAWAAGPLDESPGGGESRAEAARRIARGFRVILERPERTILVVTHGLAVRYVLEAAEGRAPAPRLARVEEARPYRFSADELEQAVEVLEEWCAAPSW